MFVFAIFYQSGPASVRLKDLLWCGVILLNYVLEMLWILHASHRSNRGWLSYPLLVLQAHMLLKVLKPAFTGMDTGLFLTFQFCIIAALLHRLCTHHSTTDWQPWPHLPAIHTGPFQSVWGRVTMTCTRDLCYAWSTCHNASSDLAFNIVDTNHLFIYTVMASDKSSASLCLLWDRHHCPSIFFYALHQHVVVLSRHN